MTQLVGEVLDIESEVLHIVDEPVGDWKYEAACEGEIEFSEETGREIKNVFYDGDTDTVDPNKYAKAAKKICRSCEVRQQCLEWALDTDEPHGIWGGERTRERKKMLNKHTKRGRPATRSLVLVEDV